MFCFPGGDQIRGLYVDEAYAQMFLSKKRMSRLVRNTIRKAANLADIRHDLKPTQLRVKVADVGIGGRLKRVKIMGRGACVLPLHLSFIERIHRPACPAPSRAAANDPLAHPVPSPLTRFRPIRREEPNVIALEYCPRGSTGAVDRGDAATATASVPLPRE